MKQSFKKSPINPHVGDNFHKRYLVHRSDEPTVLSLHRRSTVMLLLTNLSAMEMVFPYVCEMNTVSWPPSTSTWQAWPNLSSVLSTVLQPAPWDQRPEMTRSSFYTMPASACTKDLLAVVKYTSLSHDCCLLSPLLHCSHFGLPNTQRGGREK